MERPDGRGFKTFRTFDKRRDVVYGKSLLIVRYSHMTPEKIEATPVATEMGSVYRFFLKGSQMKGLLLYSKERGFRIPGTYTSSQKQRGFKYGQRVIASQIIRTMIELLASPKNSRLLTQPSLATACHVALSDNHCTFILLCPVDNMSTSRVEDVYETQNDQRLDELHSKIRTLRGVRSTFEPINNGILKDKAR